MFIKVPKDSVEHRNRKMPHIISCFKPKHAVLREVASNDGFAHRNRKAPNIVSQPVSKHHTTLKVVSNDGSAHQIKKVATMISSPMPQHHVVSGEDTSDDDDPAEQKSPSKRNRFFRLFKRFLWG